MTHAIRGVLLSTSGSAGDGAKLNVAGVSASLTPVANAALTHLTLSAGGAGVVKPVEEALRATGLTWLPWHGCTAEQALVPVGADMPLVADAKNKAMSAVEVAGQDDYAAQAAVASIGVANAALATTVGDVAAMAAGWAAHSGSGHGRGRRLDRAAKEGEGGNGGSDAGAPRPPQAADERESGDGGQGPSGAGRVGHHARPPGGSRPKGSAGL